MLEPSSAKVPKIPERTAEEKAPTMKKTTNIENTHALCRKIWSRLIKYFTRLVPTLRKLPVDITLVKGRPRNLGNESNCIANRKDSTDMMTVLAR